MRNLYKYTVAGHTFSVCLPDGIDPLIHLKPYEPFIETSDVEPLFNLTMETVASLKDICPGKVRECLNDEAPYFWIFEDEIGKFSFGFSYSKQQPDCVLIPSDNYKNSIVYIPAAAAGRLAEFALSNAMMLLYTFCTTPYDTLMVHASVISHAGGGYMFLGRSGTGKSTHSRLWLDNIDDTSLLNDDNPVIRLIDGVAYVYGTPWSGKTPCYKNEMMPLEAVVRLSQAPHNKITRFAPLQSFASLMPACSCMRWDSESVSGIHKTVEQVISRVPCFHMECLPDADAAKVCHSAIKRSR